MRRQEKIQRARSTNRRDTDVGLCVQSLPLSSTVNLWRGHLMALTTVMILPVIVVFFVAQKRFVEGVTAVGIRG